ncbi:imidazole glycerol phosphate synthase subunit HisH [Vibrio vulnificus]|nr:imidazole glycerol phosphate synthase subunit HisH [Vibrio vulnificus]
MKVDILDIGSGNIRSVKNWIEKSNVATRIVTQPDDIQSEMLVLPGVGSAGSYMQRMKAGNFDEAIKSHVDKGCRLMGICLGFQIMMEYSEEDGYVEGLGLLDGHVERLIGQVSHNAWEALSFRRQEMVGQSFGSRHHLTQKRIFNGRVFYNHEYGVMNKSQDAFSLPVSSAFSQYSGLLVKDNIIGIQFHPEKSQISGTDLINMIL